LTSEEAEPDVCKVYREVDDDAPSGGAELTRTSGKYRDMSRHVAPADAAGKGERPARYAEIGRNAVTGQGRAG